MVAFVIFLYSITAVHAACRKFAPPMSIRPGDYVVGPKEVIIPVADEACNNLKDGQLAILETKEKLEAAFKCVSEILNQKKAAFVGGRYNFQKRQYEWNDDEKIEDALFCSPNDTSSHPFEALVVNSNSPCLELLNLETENIYICDSKMK